jgi:hypothetical protein
MPPPTDLRQHFGIWDRCGATNFWRQIDIPEYRFTLVDPLHGKMITAYEYPHVGGPALSVVVRDAQDITNAELHQAYAKTEPWAGRILDDFFTTVGAIAAGIVQGTPEEFFLKYYEDQTKKYKETGEGHSQMTGKDELLTATKKVLAALEDKSVKLRKVILRDEWDEFLESQGILEC